ncbi:hypothetical protein [Novosphingobium panipatense]|uniref:hypothetical protein n=1 Tax=Novosphingobium panipatense TaxID=428991 RepID=UPI003623B727
MRNLGKSITNRLLPRGLDTRLRSELQYRRLVQAFPTAARRHHGLAGELVVSLTSYPVRYATLHLTLKSLLRQQTVPDRIVLWIADGDVAALPRATRAVCPGHRTQDRARCPQLQEAGLRLVRLSARLHRHR